MTFAFGVGVLALSVGFVGGFIWQRWAVRGLTDELIEALDTSNARLRSLLTGKGTLGGNCSCCGAIWYSDAELHEPDCLIECNAELIRDARDVVA